MREQDQRAEAVDYADTLDPDQLAFALWRYYASNRHIGQFTANRWHPMYRANEARRLIYRVRNAVRDSAELTPAQKAELDDLFAQRLVGETRNAMIAIGVEGYSANRDMTDLGANLQAIAAIDEATAQDLQRALLDLPPADRVYAFYPDIQRETETRLQQLRAQAGAAAN